MRSELSVRGNSCWNSRTGSPAGRSFCLGHMNTHVNHAMNESLARRLYLTVFSQLQVFAVRPTTARWHERISPMKQLTGSEECVSCL
jgi:hypothetical protein